MQPTHTKFLSLLIALSTLLISIGTGTDSICHAAGTADQFPELVRKAPPKGSEVLYDVYWNRAQQAKKQGKGTDAIIFLEQALNESKSLKNDSLKEKTVIELSNIYLDLGMADKFIECQKDRGSVAVTSSLLDASKKFEAQNNLTGAILLLEFGRDEFEIAKTPLEERKQILSSLLALYKRTDDRSKSAEIERALTELSAKKTGDTGFDITAFFDDSFGSTSKTTSESLWKADRLASTGDGMDAMLAYADILAEEKKNKSNISETEQIRTVDRLCRLLCKFGRVSRAEEIARNELARIKANPSPGDAHSKVKEAYVLTDVALVHRIHSRFTLAEALLDEARRVFEETLGPDHPKTILTIADQALVKQQTSDFADAERLFKEALDKANKQPKFGTIALQALGTNYETVLRREGKSKKE